MAAVSSIVLPDAQATPVNHTFIPLGQDAKGVWIFEDQSGDSPVGYQRIGLSITRPQVAKPGEADKASRINRVKLTLYMPRLEVLGTNINGYVPPPTLAYVENCSVEFLMPDRTTLQDRKDGRKYLTGLLANAQVISLVESLQPIY